MMISEPAARRRTGRSPWAVQLLARTIRGVVVLVVLCALCTLPRVARAQAGSSSPKAQARALFKQGNQLFKRGMYLDALTSYRRARTLYPSFKIDLNIGATLDAMGRRTEAASYFERFLIQSSSAPPAIIAAARSRLDELRKRLASVKLSSLVDGATVIVDGKATGKTPLELPIYLEPGGHALRLEHAGHTPITRQLALTAGQHQSVDLSPRPQSAAPGAPDGSRSVTDPAAAAEREARARARQQAQVEASQRRRRSRTIWAYSTLGLGLALAASAGVLYGVGGSQGADAHQAYSEATDPVEIERRYEEVEAARSKLVAGHVLVGLAAASLGASVYLFLTRPEASLDGTASKMTLLPGPQGALVSYQGRF